MILKTSSRSNPASIAGAVAGTVRDFGKAEIQTVGAGALNQAIKGVAIAKGYCAPSGTELVVSPAFVDVVIDGKVKTAIKLTVMPR